MPSSLEANIGVSVKLQLNFKNIDIILKLLSSQAKLIIYGLSKPIDRDCKFDDSENKPPYFDNRILQKLTGLKNDEEFIEYSSKVAEMREDKMVLRKKLEYVNFEDEGEVDDYLEILDNYDGLNDDFDDLENDSENDSENNSENDSENEAQENVVPISDQESDIKKLKKRYEESKDEQKYVNYDLNEKKISFLFYINLLNFDLSLNLRSDYDTDFGTLGKLSEFMNDIKKTIKFFTDFGIDEESLSVFNYNSSEGY
jgi:hypothetical protein